MLEETLIRESATHKLQNRVSSGPVRAVIGPPVTFANPASSRLGPTNQDDTTNEEAKDMASEFENHFDVVQSPLRRRTTISASSAQKDRSKAVVPQEQYDALKARFIENETATQKKLESINDLEATITRREQQLETMERMYC